MCRPLERTVAFAGHSQHTSLANRLGQSGIEPQVIAERNIHLGKLWLVQPYASGAMEPAQNPFRPRCEVVKDFLTLGVEVLAPRQWYARSRFRIYLCYAYQLVPSIRNSFLTAHLTTLCKTDGKTASANADHLKTSVHVFANGLFYFRSGSIASVRTPLTTSDLPPC